MGLADFLATAGQGKTLGHVAEAFGGQTTQQKAVDDFINNQLPALADQIHKAGTKEDVAKAGQSLITSGLKAGINPQGLDKLMEMTIQPALRNMQSGELDKLRTDYGAQPAQPAESRPQGTEGPLTPSGNFIDPKAATPEKPLDLNFMMRFGQATGANPAQFNQMLGTPADIAGKQASTQHTQAAIDAEAAKEKTIQGLPNTPTAPGQPSQQDVARVPGLAQFLDARGKPEDPLLEERRNLLNAQAGAATDRGAAARARAGAAGREGHGSAMMQDFIRLGGDPNDRDGFLKFADTYRGAGKTNETEADQPYGSLDREIDLKTIARDAHAQGKTSSADIKALAAQRGLEVVGNPQLTVSGGAFGYGGTPSLTGNFELKKKPRVTTKTKAGATGDQGRYEDVPSGSAPVDPRSKAGGANSGGSGGNKPQRMKFDAQGNLVK
jgi:hypothetical protein